jgi:Rad3-related DNA helicase
VAKFLREVLWSRACQEPEHSLAIRPCSSENPGFTCVSVPMMVAAQHGPKVQPSGPSHSSGFIVRVQARTEDRMPDESIHVNQRDLDALFAPGGPLSRKLPGYEYRWGQPRLSTAMLSTIDAGEHLVAEASTGIGKSLAYLAAVVASGTPVLISTDTRILQDQLKRKDVPSLAAALNVPIDVATIKGRSNYVCELEFQCFAEEARRDRGLFEDPTYARQWPQIEAWVLQERANYGVAEFDEAPLPIPDAIREDISISSEQCLGRQCPLVDTCFAERAKARANTADVIIINHHLLLLGGLLGSQVWPAVKVVVVDEAHRLEDTASSVFSSTIGLPRWRWLWAQFRKVSHPDRDLRDADHRGHVRLLAGARGRSRRYTDAAALESVRFSATSPPLPAPPRSSVRTSLSWTSRV